MWCVFFEVSSSYQHVDQQKNVWTDLSSNLPQKNTIKLKITRSYSSNAFWHCDFLSSKVAPAYRLLCSCNELHCNDLSLWQIACDSFVKSVIFLVAKRHDLCSAIFKAKHFGCYDLDIVSDVCTFSDCINNFKSHQLSWVLIIYFKI